MKENKEVILLGDKFKQYEKVINVIRFAYLAYYLSVGCIHTFYPVVLNKIHVSNSQIGILSSIGLVGGIISPIFIGFLADKTKKSKLILIIISSFTIILHLIPILCILLRIHITKLNYKKSHSNSTEINAVPPEYYIDSAFLYFLYFIQFLLTFGDQGTKALIDSLSHKVIVEAESIGYKVDFSKIRMFGGIGIGISALMSGICLDYVKWQFPNFPEDICLLTLCLSMGILCVISLLIYVPDAETKGEVNFAKALKVICTRTDVIVCYLTQFGIQLAANITKNFESLYIKHLGGNKSLIGISHCLGYLADVGAMYYSKSVFQAIGSKEETISFAILVSTFRTFFYGFADSHYLALSNAILSGVSVGLYLPTMSTLVREKSPGHLISSYVSLLGGIGKIGASIASYVGGVISEKYSYNLIYCISSIIYGLSFLLMVGYFYINRSMSSKKMSKEVKYSSEEGIEKGVCLLNEEKHN